MEPSTFSKVPTSLDGLSTELCAGSESRRHVSVVRSDEDGGTGRVAIRSECSCWRPNLTLLCVNSSRATCSVSRIATPACASMLSMIALYDRGGAQSSTVMCYIVLRQIIPLIPAGPSSLATALSTTPLFAAWMKITMVKNSSFLARQFNA